MSQRNADIVEQHDRRMILTRFQALPFHEGRRRQVAFDLHAPNRIRPEQVQLITETVGISRAIVFSGKFIDGTGHVVASVRINPAFIQYDHVVHIVVPFVRPQMLERQRSPVFGVGIGVGARFRQIRNAGNRVLVFHL